MECRVYKEYGVRTVLKLTAADIRKVPWICSKYVPFQSHNRKTQGPMDGRMDTFSTIIRKSYPSIYLLENIQNTLRTQLP